MVTLNVNLRYLTLKVHVPVRTLELELEFFRISIFDTIQIEAQIETTIPNGRLDIIL